MCGIAGSIFSGNQVDHQVLKDLRHRGPDDQTFYQHENVILYHTRLAIQDVHDGTQPMKLGDNLVIVFNGEIYNHLELRKKYNLDCATRSDTETILHLYKKLGKLFLDDLDGMFAFAIYDLQKKTVWLARDRAGKKPLYYYNDNGKWIFSSELNTLAKQVKLEIEERNIYEYLRVGALYRSHTPYKNVAELQGGHWLEININSDKAEERKWWSIQQFYNKPQKISEEDAMVHCKKILDVAVSSRMDASDLEVGCFLSGGIDSGLVATSAAKNTDALKTFTVAFQGAYNEAPLAKLVADKIGSHHTEINIDFSDLQDNIINILGNYGEPFMDSSAIPTWYVSREAKKYVTVILNGDGADELFGGYRRYVPFSHYDFFNTPPIIRSVGKALATILPVSNSKKSKYNYLHRLLNIAHKKPLDTYLAAGFDIFEGYQKAAFVSQNGSFDLIEQDVEKYVEEVNGGLEKLMLLDFEINLFSDLLVKMDIGTMAHALEGRSPFLCKDFLEWVPTLPASLKIKGSTTKYLLRKIAIDQLPPSLINQPKRGFEIPLKNWVDGQLKGIIHDYLFSSNVYCTNFVNKSFLLDVWNKKIKLGDEKRAKILWSLFALEVWHKNAYNKN